MASNKQQPINPLGDTFAPIAEPIHSKQPSFLRRHLRWVIVIAIIIVVGGGAAAALFVSPWSTHLQQIIGLQKKPSAKTTANPSTPVGTATLENMPKGTTQAQVTAVNAGQQLGQGNKTQAKQLYATALSQATTDVAKAKILLQEASDYQSAQDYQDALATAQQALTYDQSDPATQVYNYSLIGGIYQQMKDNNNAITYYQKVIDVLNAHPDLASQSGYSVQMFQQQIDSLNGSSGSQTQ